MDVSFILFFSWQMVFTRGASCGVTDDDGDLSEARAIFSGSSPGISQHPRTLSSQQLLSSLVAFE